MTDAWILKSKLTPPSPPTGWMSRRLGADAPVTLLVAGPGYGKTLGLLGLVAEAEEAGTPTIWYSADALDADAATFFHHLNAGMQSHIPQFGETVRALLGGDRQDPRLLWQAFFGQLAAFNLPGLVIAIDDFQHLNERLPGVAEALGYFFDKLPSGVRLLIASRQRLPTPVARLAARGFVRTLGASELRFSPDEERAYLAALAPDGRVSDAWGRAAARLDGWPLGLELLAAGGSEASPLRDYVFEELYRAQPPERRTLMRQCALLAEITPEACREVFGEPDAAGLLEAMAEAHLLQPLAGAGAYRFPTYLHEILMSELDRAVAREERAGWHRRAGAYYRRCGRGELALPHLVAAGDWDGARSVCRTVFTAMRFDGRHAQLRRWLEAFPAEVATDDPWWLLWRAHTLAYGGQSAEALDAYARARSLHEAAGDAAGAFKALVGQANAALTLQREDDFAALLAAAGAHRGRRHAEDEVDLWLIRAYDAERQGDMAGMRACNEAALRLPIADNVEIAASHAIALTNMATHTLYQGDLAQARRFLNQAIETSTAWRFDGYRLGARFLLAHLQVLEGDTEGAATFLGALPPMWREVLDWHDVAIAHTVLGAYHLARGEFAESERTLHHAWGIFERAGFLEGRKVPLERLMALAVQRRQPARALALAEEVATDGRGLHDLAIDLPRARALHQLGRSAEAAACLAVALSALEALGARLHVARGRLYEAAALASIGRVEDARRALAAAQALIDSHGYGFLRGQDRGLWEELQPLEAAPVALESSVPAALELKVLGPFEARLGGVLLDQWPRRKARLLLAALALKPEGLRADELAELVGHGEANPANVLRVNAWALRRVLEPELGKGAPSRYLLVAGDRYRLNPACVATRDLDAFERAMAEADSLKQAAPREAARAIDGAMALVRGDLLDEGGPFAVFEPAREAFRRRCVDALHWLGAHHRRGGDYARAEAALVRAIAIAPCDEGTYMAAMKLYRALGQADRLRRTYWDCRRALKAQQGLTPSEAFEAAYRACLAGGP
jgi:ATP/maltotriose-dependent transcriptional regulator MalT/DNA-binding SARP family transcriptional activator